jgi:hypothetical protein
MGQHLPVVWTAIKKILKHLGLWEVKPRPPPRMAKTQPLHTEPHIDYSARPGATQFFVVACDCALFQTRPLKNTVLVIGLGQGLAGLPFR